jgi:hypothetical protein
LPQILETLSTSAAATPNEVPVTEWKNPIWTMIETARSVTRLGPLAVVGLPIVLGFSALGAFSLSRREPLVVAIFLTHIPLILLCLQLLGFRIWPRYFFVDLAFIFLCVVRGVFAFADYLARSINGSRRPRLTGETMGVIGSCVAAVCSLFLLPANYRYPKQDFIGARDFIEGAQAPGDSVASIGLASYAFSKYYAPEWRVVDSWEEIQDAPKPSDRMWLVYVSQMHMAANYPEVLERLPSEFELMKEFPGTLGDGTVFVYRRRTGSELQPSRE